MFDHVHHGRLRGPMKPPAPMHVDHRYNATQTHPPTLCHQRHPNRMPPNYDSSYGGNYNYPLQPQHNRFQNLPSHSYQRHDPRLEWRQATNSKELARDLGPWGANYRDLGPRNRGQGTYTGFRGSGPQYYNRGNFGPHCEQRHQAYYTPQHHPPQGAQYDPQSYFQEGSYAPQRNNRSNWHRFSPFEQCRGWNRRTSTQSHPRPDGGIWISRRSRLHSHSRSVRDDGFRPERSIRPKPGKMEACPEVSVLDQMEADFRNLTPTGIVEWPLLDCQSEEMEDVKSEDEIGEVLEKIVSTICETSCGSTQETVDAKLEDTEECDESESEFELRDWSDESDDDEEEVSQSDLGWLDGDGDTILQRKIRTRWQASQWSLLQNPHFVRSQARSIVADIRKCFEELSGSQTLHPKDQKFVMDLEASLMKSATMMKSVPYIGIVYQ